ncbi:MAG TPA: SDR family NAD(P)-dependent oxidoreductase [Azospirillum sp.]|nr:SDR family NAD(P)-dependent oxidoreductase [Azospirillum sp.]
MALTGIGQAGALAGRHAVVTGGGRGIGAAVAAALARLGADVTVMGRTRGQLEDRAADLRAAYGVRAAAEVVDLTDPPSIEAGFKSASDRLGPPAILVNNAGVALAAPFHKTDLALWRQVMDVDLTGVFLCSRQVLRGMVDAGWGRIVNVASTAGHTGYPYVTAYCAAKHGVIGLTRALAREMAKTAVTINAVCPGYTDTDIVGDSITNIMAKTGRTREQALAELVAHNPQGRLVKPEEVADAVAWLCLPSSASLTGQSIVIAGGELL